MDKKDIILPSAYLVNGIPAPYVNLGENLEEQYNIRGFLEASRSLLHISINDTILVVLKL